MTDFSLMYVHLLKDHSLNSNGGNGKPDTYKKSLKNGAPKCARHEKTHDKGQDKTTNCNGQ